MFDTINVPREGVASFSDDGYPTSDSSNFGPAANKKQRDVPRAFLRSATHEVTHGFNQIHQENEGGADNSIMTTSPGVADYLGGATGHEDRLGVRVDGSQSVGQFFAEWAVYLNAHSIGGYSGMKWYLDGKQQTGNPATLIFKPHQEIAFVVGKAPAKIPSSFAFAAGQ